VHRGNWFVCPLCETGACEETDQAIIHLDAEYSGVPLPTLAPSLRPFERPGAARGILVGLAVGGGHAAPSASGSPSQPTSDPPNSRGVRKDLTSWLDKRFF